MLTLGTRTSRPHSVRSTLNPFLAMGQAMVFALSAQCGGDVRASGIKCPRNQAELAGFRYTIQHQVANS